MESSLPAPRWSSATTASASAVVVAGGYDPNGKTAAVVVASRLDDGRLSDWQKQTSLPASRTDARAAFVDGTAFIVSGWGDTSNADYADVLTTSLGPSGISLWHEAPAFPYPRLLYGLAYAAGSLVVTGGEGHGDAGQQVFFNDTLLAPASSAGVTGAWTRGAPLPRSPYGHGMVAHGSDVYVIGGRDPAADIVADILVARVQSGAIGGWTATAPLPAARIFVAACIHGDDIFVAGGLDATGVTPQTSVFSAHVTGTDGALGAWQTVTPLPNPRGDAACVVF
jgi:hypothetical protein